MHDNTSMKLYNFFRSGTSHRLRIALNLKGLSPQYVAVHLGRDEHKQAAFKALNPQGLVPALEHEGQILIQSPAIIEWLDEKFPTPALLPANIDDRARVRALAAIIGCDIHPVNNKRILDYLRAHFACDTEAVNTWCQTWIHAGFEAYEALVAADPRRGRFSFGNSPTLADVYLIAQVESSRRFKVDLAPYPLIRAIDQACAELPAFAQAAPGLQPDAA